MQGADFPVPPAPSASAALSPAEAAKNVPPEFAGRSAPEAKNPFAHLCTADFQLEIISDVAPGKNVAQAALNQAFIAKAAEVKIAEDMKPQKIKAIKYLARIGCGCYDLDGSITQAMVEALGDCTEDVRLQTIKALEGVADKEKCDKCQERSCCDEKILLKLAD